MFGISALVARTAKLKILILNFVGVKKSNGILLAFLLAGCVEVPPLPSHKTVPHAPAGTNAPPPPPREWFIPWTYPPGLTNYCWTLQVSTNLATWADVPSDCLTGSLTVYATNNPQFFRLKGTR